MEVWVGEGIVDDLLPVFEGFGGQGSFVQAWIGAYGEAVLVGEGLDGLLGSEVLACGDVVDGVVGEEGC